MWKWLDKLGEFAVTNARVVREAWGAFAIWCLIAVAACWYVLGQIYEVRLTTAQSAVSALSARLSAVDGELRDARSRPADLPKSVERDPDALYQFGKSTARILGGVIDRAAGLARFPQVLGEADFNVRDNMEFRQFTLTACNHGNVGTQGSGNFVTSQIFWDVTCRISGLRP